MGETERFQPGNPICFRMVKDGLVLWAVGLRVIEDSPDTLALWLGEGSPYWSIVDAEGNATRDFQRAHHLAERRWGMFEFIWLIRPGDAHAKWCAFALPGRTHAGWYINLQRPVERYAHGFDSLDHTLDLQIAPDLVHWQWKDEDELAYAVSLGIYTEAEAAAFRAEGERVLAEMRAGAAPFTSGWERWRPPAAWTVPGLPAGWDTAAGTRPFGPGDRWPVA